MKRRPIPADRGKAPPAVRGFNLTELVIVLGIIAVLMALAVPSYRDFVMKSRRTEAKELLYTAAQRQQQYFTMHNRYTADAGQLSVPATSTNGYYNLAIAAGTTGSINTSYLLTATPVSGTSQAGDSACGTYSLNSLGTKTVSGSQTTPPCW
jgi:type IV pilus assembly protein PilE